MKYCVSKEEYNNVINSNKEQRFNYFLHRALPRSSYIISIDEINKSILLYPFIEYVDKISKSEKLNHRDFVGKILKNEEFSEYKINVFPTNAEDGLIFTVNEFYKIIKEERKSY